MKKHALIRKQFLPINIDEAWDFFSSPKNLAVITPKRLNFEILSDTGNGKMFQGQIIQYKITVLPLVRMFWETEITDVQELKSFTDIQRRGPYAHWLHKHNFKSVDGGIETVDELEYALPLGPLGIFANSLFVRREVEQIFDYRFRVLENHFKKGK
jgi:ligand-binding SRPBCC domain-containing protein